MIQVEDLCFCYAENQTLTLRNLSFAVEDGEVLGFLGPSGAGKSTTQKVLIGLLQDYRGKVRILDKPLHEWHEDLYEHVGVAFERPNHFLKLTARENLDYFRSLYAGATTDPSELLRLFGLSEDADRRVGQFSKGMRVRLNLARALLNRPKLLFLDEPTTGLDPVNAQIIKDKIRALSAEGTTIFLTTHNMSVADEVCDRVAFIVDGAISTIESPRELKLQYGTRRIRVELGDEQAIESHEFPLDDLADNEEFLALLRRPELQTVHTQETTLEKVFIEVTGRGLS